ncbi:MAG: fluoride efflux transporter FluC [Cyanobium sp.]
MGSPSLQNAVLVALGAVPGAWLRYRLVDRLAPLLPRRHWATFAVNVSACFSLGLVTALIGRRGGDQRLSLLLATGFLGSLSTFSSFSVEVLQAWLGGERRQALALVIGSLAVGLLAVLIGLNLGPHLGPHLGLEVGR